MYRSVLRLTGACLGIAFIYALSVATPGGATAYAAEEREGSAETVDTPMEGEMAVEDEPLIPRRNTVSQLLVGTAVSYGSWLIPAGLAAPYLSTHGPRMPDSIAVMTVGSAILGPPLSAALLVNLMGVEEFSVRKRGAFIGALAVTGLSGGAYFAGGWLLDSETIAGAALFPFPFLATVGAIIGYHRQAKRDVDRPGAQHQSPSVMPTAIVDTSDDKQKFGLGLRGRF